MSLRNILTSDLAPYKDIRCDTIFCNSMTVGSIVTASAEFDSLLINTSLDGSFAVNNSITFSDTSINNFYINELIQGTQLSRTIAGRTAALNLTGPDPIASLSLFDEAIPTDRSEVLCEYGQMTLTVLTNLITITDSQIDVGSPSSLVNVGSNLSVGSGSVSLGFNAGVVTIGNNLSLINVGQNLSLTSISATLGDNANTVDIGNNTSTINIGNNLQVTSNSVIAGLNAATVNIGNNSTVTSIGNNLDVSATEVTVGDNATTVFLGGVLSTIRIPSATNSLLSTNGLGNVVPRSYQNGNAGPPVFSSVRISGAPVASEYFLRIHTLVQVYGRIEVTILAGAGTPAFNLNVPVPVGGGFVADTVYATAMMYTPTLAVTSPPVITAVLASSAVRFTLTTAGNGNWVIKYNYSYRVF